MNYNNNKNRIEERVYSVTMTEEELRLFSEFLSFSQRLYNNDDELVIEEEEEEITPELIKHQRHQELGIPDRLPEVPITVREDTAEVRKIKRDRLKEKYSNKIKQGIDHVKGKYNALDDKYDELFGRDLGKDAAIVAAGTAALGAGAYGVHKYLKNRKKSEDEAEKKYKTSDDKKNKK